MSSTIVMVADIPSGAEAGFQAYESAVLPLLPRYGRRLDRRLRNGDALTEVHSVSFASQKGFESCASSTRSTRWASSRPSDSPSCDWRSASAR